MLSEKRKKIKQFYRSKQKKTNDITKRNQKEKKILTKKQRNQLINAIDKQSKRERERRRKPNFTEPKTFRSLPRRRELRSIVAKAENQTKTKRARGEARLTFDVWRNTKEVQANNPNGHQLNRKQNKNNSSHVHV